MSGQCAWFMTDLATEPDQGAIHLSGTPAESITEAAECRSVCNPDRAGSQARIAAASSARNAMRGSQRSLSSVVNTYVGRCQAEPALRRSAACQVRTSPNTRSVGGEAFAGGAGGSRSCGRQLERAASQDLWKAVGVRDRRMGSR
jgi:hypothetical protein